MFKLFLMAASYGGALCAIIGIVWMFMSADPLSLALIALGGLGGVLYLWLERRYPDPDP